MTFANDADGGQWAMTPTVEYCSALSRNPAGHVMGSKTDETLGLVVSPDMAFPAKVRAELAGGRAGTIALHRCATAAEAAEQAGLRHYAYGLLDARRSPMRAVDMLATILSASPRLPVVVCLAHSEVRPPEKQLRALGAFEIVTDKQWPGEKLIAALRHAIWFAGAARPDEPASGFSEPDRPLLAEVSHEMRSPLNSIIGFAESIEQQALGPWPSQEDRYRDYARLIRNSGEHLLALFNDLLEIGDSTTFTLELKDQIDAAALAQNVTTMMRSAAEQKGVSLVCEAPVQTRPVQCNARFLSQALLNLLQNSIKFTDRGGSVVLSVRQDDETSFTVSDTGVGFAPERLMLPRNSRIGRSTNSGHGLGLRFVERVTAAHRGQLNIESRQGRGSKIRISLPPEQLALGSATVGAPVA